MEAKYFLRKLRLVTGANTGVLAVSPNYFSLESPISLNRNGSKTASQNIRVERVVSDRSSLWIRLLTSNNSGRPQQF
jgi:hypothetical protein